MNINQLRTPEGLDHYLNVVLPTLPIKMPDNMLVLLLWQKIKNDFLISEEQIEKYLEDDNDHTLVIDVNKSGTKFIIGYLHLQENLHTFTSHGDTIVEDANKFITDLKQLAKLKDWKKYQIILITTYPLSWYKKIILEKLTNNVRYFFLTESPEIKAKCFQISVDTKTNEFMEGDILLKNLLRLGNEGKG